MGTKKSSIYQSPIARIFEKFSRQQDVSLIYGEPINFENKKVLPVAKINYIVGGGGGYSGETGEFFSCSRRRGRGAYLRQTFRCLRD